MKTHSLFAETFGTVPDVFSQAPGRLEILGNHTDYNEGYVLSMAVDRSTCISLKKIEGDVCQISSPALSSDVVELALSDINLAPAQKHWSCYVRGVIGELQKRGFRVPAFQALITSSIPMSAGMSSSAALEMSLVTGLDLLCGFQLSDQVKARIGQGTENNYIHANTGLMDQLSSVCCRQGNFLFSEYRDLELMQIPFPDDLSFVVINSGVEHDLSEEYNERREQCESAVEYLSKMDGSITALRDVDEETLLQHRDALEEDVFRRALHVVQENARVQQASELLRAGDIENFGALLSDSHKSSGVNFENSCAELDAIVQVAEHSSYCYGARLSGGGFGGISIHLVKDENVEAYIKYAELELADLFSDKPEIFVCKSANDAAASLVRE